MTFESYIKGTDLRIGVISGQENANGVDSGLQYDQEDYWMGRTITKDCHM